MVCYYGVRWIFARSLQCVISVEVTWHVLCC